MKKILQLSALMTMLMMVSSSLFSMRDMKMEPMDAPCKSLASLAGDRAVVYLEDALQESLLKLHELYPQWGSELFKQLCRDLKSKANVLLHEQAVQVVDECAAFCDQELQKDVADKQAFEVIKADLQDYQQFLASAESRLNPQDEMATKRRCCAPAVNCFNIAPYIPFLLTGPVAPGNYFYAVRQDGNLTLVTATPTISFTSTPVSDGSWTLVGGTDFTAQVSGVFLISAIIPYQHPQTGAIVASTTLLLQPTLDSSAIPAAGVTYNDDYSNAGINFDVTFQLATTFIVSVSVGQILRFTQSVTGPGLIFQDAQRSLTANNGLVSITRLR